MGELGTLAHPPGAMGRLLLEHVGRVASPDVAMAILGRALELAGLTAIPPAGAISAFVAGPLFEALCEELDESAAHAVQGDLELVLARADDSSSSGTRVRAERGDPTPRAVVPRRTVVIASGSRERTRALRSQLLGDAEVLVADDLCALVQLLERTRAHTLVVSEIAGLQGPMLSTVARLLPRESSIVLWGIPAKTQLGAQARFAPIDASIECVARLCLMPPERIVKVDPGKKLVVIAAADTAWRAVLVDWLERDGYAVVVCVDGFTALEACIDHKPAVIVAEVALDALDGKELARLVRARFKVEAPPILFVSDRALALPNEMVLPVGRGQPPAAVHAEVKRRAPIT